MSDIDKTTTYECLNSDDCSTCKYGLKHSLTIKYQGSAEVYHILFDNQNVLTLDAHAFEAMVNMFK